MAHKDSNNDHHLVVKKEFARQSKSMQGAKLFTDRGFIDRIRYEVLKAGKNVRVLDLGCGPGIVTTAIAQDVGEVVAFDITPEMIQETRRKSEELGLGNIRFEIGKAESLPFEDAYFDAIVTRFTMHHFTALGEVLAEMVRVLRVNGRIIIADVVSSENASESELRNTLEVLRDPAHVRMLPLSELQTLIGLAKLRIVGFEEWIIKREFGEWIRITNAPERKKPLFTVMKALAESGMTCGINLRFDGSKIRFNHRMVMVTAQK